MKKRGSRQIIFVCSSIKNGILICKMIESQDRDNACKIFESENEIKPQIVLGPFFKKKVGVLDSEVVIKFSGVTKKAIYNEWNVKAVLLSSPEGHAYIFYDKRIDNKKIQKPVSTIVKLEELKELQ